MKYNIIVLPLISAIITFSLIMVRDSFAEVSYKLNTISASNKDEEQEFNKYKKQKLAGYYKYKRFMLEEFIIYKKIHQQELERYKKSIDKIWDNAELSSPKVWVEYSENLHEKKKVDFELQTITLSKVIGKNRSSANKTSLEEQLTKLLTENKEEAFKADIIAQAVERESKKVIKTLTTAKVKADPILIPYLTGGIDYNKEDIKSIVKYMMDNKKEHVTIDKNNLKVTHVQVPLKAPATLISGMQSRKKSDSRVKPLTNLNIDNIPIKARPLEADIHRYAKKNKLTKELIFAIIESESAFNPMAKSPIPAYGLMQIVPISSGIDVTEYLNGKPTILSPSYLYNSEKNIEAGSTYLHLLFYRYLRKIQNKTSRLYCSIAAYNTGAGNVAKAFTGKMSLNRAVKKINTMTSDQVYKYLIINLPYEETRRYLKIVTQRMDKYKS